MKLLIEKIPIIIIVLFLQNFSFADTNTISKLEISLYSNDLIVQIRSAAELRTHKWEPKSTIQKAEFYIFSENWEAARAMGIEGGKAALKHLIKINSWNKYVGNSLDFHNPWKSNMINRIKMCTSIALASEENISSKLLQLLVKSNEEVKPFAADALRESKWRPVKKDDEINYYIILKDWKSAFKLGNTAVALFTKNINGEDWSFQENLAKALANDINKYFEQIKIVLEIENTTSSLHYDIVKEIGENPSEKGVKLLIANLHNINYLDSNYEEALIKTAAISTPYLFSLLKNGFDKERSYALIVLSKLGRKDILPYLIDEIKNGPPEIKTEAITALANLKGNQTYSILINLLKTEKDNYIRDVMNAIWRHSAKGKSYVIHELSSRSNTIRDAVFNAIQQNEWSPENDDEAIAYYIVSRNWEKIIPYGEKAVKKLGYILEGSEAEQDYRIYEIIGTLGKIHTNSAFTAGLKFINRIKTYSNQIAPNLVFFGDRIVLPMQRILRSDDNIERRKIAIETLGLLKNKESVPLILKEIDSPDLEMQKIAITALGNIGTKKADDVLYNLLKNNQSKLKKVILLSLFKTGDMRVKAYLEQYLEKNLKSQFDCYMNTEEMERYLSAYKIPLNVYTYELLYKNNTKYRDNDFLIRYISNYEKPEYIPYLLQYLTSEIKDISAAAYNIIKKLNWTPTNNREKVILALASKDWKTCRLLEDETYQVLMSRLGSIKPHNGTALIAGLSNIGGKHIVKILVSLLNNSDYLIREAAAQELSKIGWKPYTEREKAVFYIGTHNGVELVKMGKTAVPYLIALLKTDFSYEPKDVDKTFETIDFGQSVLRRIGKDAFQTLFEGAKKEQGFINETCYAVLVPMSKEIDDELADQLSSLDEESVVTALNIISMIDRLDINKNIRNKFFSLSQHLPSFNNNTRWRIAKALDKIDDILAIPILIKLSKDYDISVVSEALNTLIVKDYRDVSKIIHCLDYKDTWVLQRALELVGNSKEKKYIPKIIPFLKNQNEFVREAAETALSKLGWKKSQ